MKTYNYIDCTLCKNWNDETKSSSLCSRCKNSGKIIDPKELLCNMCGGPMCHDITVPSGRWHPDTPHGLFDVRVSGGYDSYHLFDMTSYTFSFCEECLRKLFLQCKIPPTVTEYGIGNDPKTGELTLVDRDTKAWEEDKLYYELRVWKDAGGHHQAYLDRKCNGVKDCPNQAVYTLLHNDTDFTEEARCEEHKDQKWLNSSLVKFISNTLKPFL